MSTATTLCRALAALGLMLAAGCAARPASPAARSSPNGHIAASQSPAPVNPMRKLAAEYMAISRPANHRLDLEVAAYDHNAHSNLAAAEAALRAEASTERHWDRQLLKIPFPSFIAATARSLVVVNSRRANFTARQARSRSIAAMIAMTSGHKAADAAVERYVRLIRRELGLPPPSSS